MFKNIMLVLWVGKLLPMPIESIVNISFVVRAPPTESQFNRCIVMFQYIADLLVTVVPFFYFDNCMSGSV